MPRPVSTREGVFLLAGVLAVAGLVLALSDSPSAFTIALFVASAAVLTAGITREVLAFLSPRTDGSRDHTTAGAETEGNPKARSNGENVDRTQ